MIILDTHAWIFYVANEHDQLSKKALQAIEKADEFGVSAISCWEVAMLVDKGRLHLEVEVRQWIGDALQHPKLQVMELSPEVLIASVQLQNFNKDPADRMIAATCYLNSWPLLTKDRLIKKWGQIETIW